MTEDTEQSESFSLLASNWLPYSRLICLFWIAAIIAMAAMACTSPVGWDARVLWRTVEALKTGGDPYAQGLAALKAFHSRAVAGGDNHPPLVYVYSPMTLPLLRLVGLPAQVLGLLYGTAIAAGSLLQLWSGFQMAERNERRWLALMLPAVLFFPGLITDDAILSGNVAYVLYGMILAAAVPGWKRGRWFWFYAAVLAASVCKLPFLSLLAFPILIDRRQWFPSGLVGMTGVTIFAAQMLAWPKMFGEYLLTLRLMFDWEHDFGFGPAGLLGRVLWSHGRPTALATGIGHLGFVGALGIALLIVGSNLHRWKIPYERWIPAALVGTALLNPRIMKYDLAAITVPMVLIAWRAMRFAHGRAVARIGRVGEGARGRGQIIVGAACFLVANAVTMAGPSWVPVELLTLGAIFVLGIWSLDLPVFRIQEHRHAAKGSIPREGPMARAAMAVGSK